MTEPADAPKAPDQYDYCPWLFWSAPEDRVRTQRAHHLDLTTRLTASGGAIELDDTCFVSSWAAVHTDRLAVGAHSYIAAFAYLTHEITLGADTTLNPFSTVRGTVRVGNAVRIGAHTSILGFNHGTAPDREIHRQPTTTKGIDVGDDVWIGSHVVILDGVTVGDHCVIGAGSVVTRDVPDWAVVAGNPARVLRDRRGTTRGSSLSSRLEAFGQAAREQLPLLLDRCRDQHTGLFVDRPGVAPTVRASCDAIELADLLCPAHSEISDVLQVRRSSGSSGHLDLDGLARLLRSWQQPDTGLVPEFGQPNSASLDQGPAVYHILCVGYALRLLGSGFAQPIRAVQGLEPDELRSRLLALDWKTRAWSAGSWVDAIGTALLFDRQDFGIHDATTDTLFGWLLATADRGHGMWGSFDPRNGRLQVVNGFYRLTRGTFAQDGLPVPYPERAIDTVLAHTTDRSVFGDADQPRGNACNVLDVIHPLWLCARQTDHRLNERRAWARTHLDRALSGWQPELGCSFDLRTDNGSVAGLQGTEMWLAIIWLLADHLGESEALGYRPRGIHRPEPVAEH